MVATDAEPDEEAEAPRGGEELGLALGRRAGSVGDKRKDETAELNGNGSAAAGATVALGTSAGS